MKILIADDHQLFLSGLRALFEAEKEMEVCGEATTGHEAISQTELLKPDVVIMDINMPGMNGIEATREIIAIAPDTKILALSIHSSKEYVQAMLDAGAAGYIPKDDAPEELIKAIKIVNKGEMYLSPAVTRAALSKDEDEGELKGLNILKTKLQRPPVLAEYIVRNRIIEELEENIMKPFSLISAGAGYGKSVVVSQWLEQTRYLYTWISLDEEHNDLQMFLLYIVEAVNKVIPGSLKETGMALIGIDMPPFEQLSNILFNNLCDIEQDLILVLDDYHKIKDDKVHQLLDDWLRFPPPNVHLSIITRRDPPLANINSLRMSGRMTELRMDSLSVTKDEIAQLFKQLVNLDLSESSVEILHDKTEGWIIALRLATMIIKSGEDSDQIIKTIEGGLNTISDYLIEEVLLKQPDHIRDQLLKSSILNRFCAELLDETTLDEAEKDQQNINGEEFILWLRKENMLVIDLDLEGKWFRYHHLFQTLLQEQLKRVHSEDKIVGLQLKASHWFEQQNLIEESFHYALVIEDFNRAIQIIEENRIDLLNTYKLSVLERLLSHLPESIINSTGVLLLIKAQIHTNEFNELGLSEVLAKIESLIKEGDDHSSYYGEYLLYKGHSECILKNDIPKGLNLLYTALEKIPESSTDPRATTELHIAIFEQTIGQFEKTNNWLQTLLSGSDEMHPLRRNRLYLTLLWINHTAARLDQVQKYHLPALNSARETKDEYNIFWCTGTSGMFHLQRGEWKEAIIYLTELMGKKFVGASRAAMDGFTGLTIAYLIQGQKEESIKIIQNLESFIEALGPNVVQYLWSCKLKFNILANNIQEVKILLNNLPTISEWSNFFYYDSPRITYCRALIFEGSAKNLKLVGEKLKELKQFSSSQHNTMELIQINALEAILYEKQNKFEASVTSLLKAVELAEPGRVILCFVELGRPLMNIIDKLPIKIKEKDFIGEIIRAIESSSILQFNQLPEKLLKESRKSQKEQLNIFTQSELAVLKCIAEGLRNQEIAEKLFNSEETIKKHIYHMFQKLQVKNRLSLVTKAKEEGLLE